VRESPIKKEPFFIERDNEKRKAFDEEVAQLPPENDIVYVDECGIEDKYMQCNYARSLRGERVFMPQPGRRFKRVNIVAGLKNGSILVPTKYEHNTNAEWFEEWFEWYLCPVLCEGDVVIMDNASFHKKANLEKIASSYGCRIIWLPPYSPDKNPIEHTWANLKNWLRIHSREYGTIQNAVSGCFRLK
jgi:transposase